MRHVWDTLIHSPWETITIYQVVLGDPAATVGPRFVLPWLPVSAAEGFPHGCGSTQHNSISWHKYKRWGLSDWYCDSAASVPTIYILVFDAFCTCKVWRVFGRVSFRSLLAGCGYLFMWCIGEASGKPLQGVRYKASFFPQLRSGVHWELEDTCSGSLWKEGPC